MMKAVLAVASDSVRRVVYSSERLHRLASLIAGVIWRDDSSQWCRIRSGPARGLWMQAQPRTQKFEVAGTYEPAVTRAFVEHARGTVWDVGAHTGYFVLVALRLGGAVVAIEPDPRNVARLRATMARNSLAATLVEAAAGAQEGTVRLETSDVSQTSRISDRGTAVRMTTLDALYELNPAQPPSFVKIDVEGLEAAVLQGAQRVLREAKPVVVVELHAGGDRQSVLGQLPGYSVSQLGAGHVLAVPQ